ncbi:MAG: hypothetical protein KDD31_07225, partial [Muricauda sp.]|nr:hypothetical protein [Allomuricauda sp.]
LNNISSAQSNMQQGYADGSLGVLVSGTVWLVSALVAYYVSDYAAIWTLFFGGMLIFPLGLLLCKILGIPGKHSKANPLGNLAMEGTFCMLMCIPMALLLSQQDPAWFFQGMLLIIGGRYLTFSTLYGKKAYWVLGGLLGMAAFVLFSFEIDSAFSAIVGSTIEIGFGIFLFLGYKKSVC